MDWAYNHTVLKMIANLNSETLLTLGDSRLNMTLRRRGSRTMRRGRRTILTSSIRGSSWISLVLYHVLVQPPNDVAAQVCHIVTGVNIKKRKTKQINISMWK